MGGSYSQANYDKDRYTEPYMASHPPDAAKDKVVAVTGATGNGLGLKFAMSAAKLGAAKVILLNRESERATKAVEVVRAVAPAGCVVSSVDCDLTSLDSVRAAGPKLKAESGGVLDVLMVRPLRLLWPGLALF
jgi:NAD(P)-dependent dehydrogenase (short-subunit alcohol dehydrogenase family)